MSLFRRMALSLLVVATADLAGCSYRSPTPLPPAAPPLGTNEQPAPPSAPSAKPRLSRWDLDAMLADGQPHLISLLFEDALAFRVRPDAGAVRGKNGQGIISLNGATDALAQLDALIAKYEFARIAPKALAGTTEAELAQREANAESKTGRDFPNEGSYAFLQLADFDADDAKALVLALQDLSCVREVGFLPNVADVPLTIEPGPVTNTLSPEHRDEKPPR